MNELLHGKIFAVPLPDRTFIFGRVLLDIYGVLKRRLLPADSPLSGLGQAHLVEMYSEIKDSPVYAPSSVLIAGAYVESKEIGSMWPILGERVVDPRGIDFPESVIGFAHSNGQMAFECGEISVPLPYSLAEQQRIGVFKRRHSAFLWPYTCLRVVGRGSEIPVDYKMATLEGGDLRLSPFRMRVYEHLPFQMKMSYFEKQRQLGLNIERLYE
jgi:hypothetical protein